MFSIKKSLSVLAILMVAASALPVSAAETGDGGHHQQAPDPSVMTPVYRLYNNRNKEHLFTTSFYEAQSLSMTSSHTDWDFENIAWYSPTQNVAGQVFRVYNPNSGEHLYTMSNYEAQVLSEQHGWQNEGVAFNSAPSTAMPIYRLYNPDAGVGAHFQTASSYERDQLVKNAGWKYEGVAYYGYAVN